MARNNRRHDQAQVPLRVVVQWAIDTAFNLWHIVHSGKGKSSSKPATYWKHPLSRWVKCNVDAAFSEQDGSASSGVILQDSDGRACGGTAKWYEHNMSALSAEARACCDGLQFARERGVTRVQLETDCQVLVSL